MMQPAAQARRSRLVIVQRRLTHYRVPLFEALRQALDGAGFELSLVIGERRADERSRQDEGKLDWAVPVRCRYVLGTQLCWLSIAGHLQGADFVVLTQETRQLHNLPLLLAPQPCRVALWGHGANLQAQGLRARAAQRVKRALLRRADWAFAYTELSAALMRSDMPDERISVVNNAVDTAALAAELDALRVRSRGEHRQALGLPGGPLAVFLGSLQPDKRLDLLIDAAERVRERCPDFQLAVLGAGPLAPWLAGRCAQRPWVHPMGAVLGPAKARWLAAADLMVLPGAVGLGILDAFAAGLPLVTTEGQGHGPEIAYLAPGSNGVITAPRADAIADAVLALLNDPDLRERMGRAACVGANSHSLQAMVGRFVQGMNRWRASPPR